MNEDLIKAASRGDLAEVNLLLTNGANVNAKAKNDFTALITASSKGHREIVEMLLAK